MKALGFKKFDAFSVGKSSGNPAGAIYLDENERLSEIEMQQIAFEMKGYVSEVAFVKPVTDADYQYNLKFYSSEREVLFCGHATVAVMYDLIKTNEALLEQSMVTIKTAKGLIFIENRVQEHDAVYITAPPANYQQCELSREETARGLQMDSSWIDPNLPIERIDAGLETLLVPIDSIKHCLSLMPELEQLKMFCESHQIDTIMAFTREVEYLENAFHTRVFAPPFGYLEDPATGSASAALGYYLLDHKLWSGQAIQFEQGCNLTYPNIVKISTGEVDRQKRVVFGGNAIVRITGHYLLV